MILSPENHVTLTHNQKPRLRFEYPPSALTGLACESPICFDRRVSIYHGLGQDRVLTRDGTLLVL